MKYNDLSIFTNLVKRYDSDLPIEKMTYWDYFDHVYKFLEKHYRNEYVYKNTFIAEWLIKKYSLKETVAFSELRIGSAIADLALFNGSSKAYEIKTELDSDKRLLNQLSEYAKVMEECFIVIPESMVSDYLVNIEPKVGIIAMTYNGRSMKMELRRDARKNEDVDIDALMSTVRCSEYKWMTKQAYGFLPDVSCFEMFDACKELLCRLTAGELHHLFLSVMKTRKNVTSQLKNIHKSARQFCLALDLNEKSLFKLNTIYNQPISV